MVTDKHILIDIPLPLETPRLILRAAREGDGAHIQAAKAETWDMLTRWMAWTAEGLGDAARDEALARRFMARFILREEIFLIGFEKASGRAVIFTGLHDIDWDLRHFTTGYWVRKSAQGQGYATEAANAVIRFAFGALGARRLEIGHAVGNSASARVIEKLGFPLEGIKRRREKLPTGEIADHARYARLDADGLPELDVRWGPP